MPRKGPPRKLTLLPDPKFGDIVVSKLINYMLKRGKKSAAERIVYDSFDLVAKRTGKDPVEVFRRAVDNVRPRVEVRSRRVGGANYQVPVEVRSDRQLALALRWIVTYSRARGEKSMTEKLAGELIESMESRSASFKKKEDVHKMAEANKAFAHYRW